MKQFIILITALAAASLISCGGGQGSDTAASDSTLCQFNNIDQRRMMQYVSPEGDTFYIDNSFSAFWPQVINGKPCTVLQQALLLELTDSAQLSQLDQAIDYLLKPNQYLEIDSATLKPVQAINTDEGHVSNSEVSVVFESMNDRLLTYHISTYDYLAGGAHGVYSNRYVTYDLAKDKAVALTDLIADTTLLRSTILRSIKQTYNYSEDDLMLPDNGLLPLPRDFFIEGSVVHVVYQVYDIASYAQGAIDAPLYPYMLKPEEMKRLFTPYGLELIDYTE